MLLVTFHGGGSGVNNIYIYSTQSGETLPQTSPQSAAGLSVSSLPAGITLDELRGMAFCNQNLYVANGGKSASGVLGFSWSGGHPPVFNYLSTLIGSGQSIMHPFGAAFNEGTTPVTQCYVSNQDSNVVARVELAMGHNCGFTGTLGSGCQSKYLSTQYPAPDAFLDGTFAASQVGALAGVAVVAPDVSEANGGLGVSGTGTPLAPSNSVRDVLVYNGILFVCDEVDSKVNMYSVDGGAYLGSGPVSDSPTHLAAANDGLWVSASESLSWSPMPSSSTNPSLSFSSVAITVPAKNKIGGISFDNLGHVYVVFQDGTHTKGTGSIQLYDVTAGSPPTLSNGQAFATISEDTPEFCLWLADSSWSS